MQNQVKNKTRLRETREQLERLVFLLKEVENNHLGLADVAKELNTTPQRVNQELSKSAFASYYKNHISKLNDADVLNLVKKITSPEERVLKRILNIPEDKYVVFPNYNKIEFWNIIKSVLDDRQFSILSKHVGYKSEPQSFEKICEEFGISRVRTQQIEAQAVEELRSTTILYKLFYYEYTDRIEELNNIKSNLLDEIYNEEAEIAKLNHYLTNCKKAKEINDYIESNYNLTSTDIKNMTDDMFDISITNLGLSNRTTNALINNGYNKLIDIYNANAEDLCSMKNIGDTSIKELILLLDSRKVHHSNWNKLRNEIIKYM